MSLKVGRYRHYKGREYQVLSLVRHSETEELLVLYRPLYSDSMSPSLWVRPLEMFQEKVDIEGKQVPRFDFIESMPGPL